MSLKSFDLAYTDNISRLSRLTAILLKLQSRPSCKVPELAKEFSVSNRTIYRDLRALESAGVPIVYRDSDGIGLMDGFRLPPVMFTQAEAYAIIVAEKMLSKTKDRSLVKAFSSAVDKIRAVLRGSDLSRANFLSDRTIIGKNWINEQTSSFLVTIQDALTNFNLLEVTYQKDNGDVSDRTVEPFAIYHNTNEHWILIAWCRRRVDWRTFRIDRIAQLRKLPENFRPHEITLHEYVEMQRKRFSNSE